MATVAFTNLVGSDLSPVLLKQRKSVNSCQPNIVNYAVPQSILGFNPSVTLHQTSKVLTPNRKLANNSYESFES